MRTYILIRPSGPWHPPSTLRELESAMLTPLLPAFTRRALAALAIATTPTP